jgi:cyclase
MDQAALEPFVKSLFLPVILSGGAGNFKHLANAIRGEGVSAVSTANLFNFMGDNLAEARKEILAHQIPLAEWSRPVSG